MSRPARVSQPKETAEPYLGAIAAASNEIRGNQEIRSSAPASRGAWWPVPARPCRLITIGWVGALTVEVASTSGVNASLRVLLRDSVWLGPARKNPPAQPVRIQAHIIASSAAAVRQSDRLDDRACDRYRCRRHPQRCFRAVNAPWRQTATRRRTRSAISAGRRSYWPLNQWYSTVTFWPST